MNEEKEYVKIDILEFLKSLWAYKVLLLVLVIIFAGLAFVKVQYFTDDTYTSSGAIYVKVKEIYTGGISAGDISAARGLTETYIGVLNLKSYHEMIVDAWEDSDDYDGTKYTPNQIASMLEIEIVNETEMFSISLTGTNEEHVVALEKIAMDQAGIKLSTLFQGEEGELEGKVSKNIKVTEEAWDKAVKNGRGLFRNIVIFSLIGFLIGALYVFLRVYFDTKVHKAEDIAKRYNISILGEIVQ